MASKPFVAFGAGAFLLVVTLILLPVAPTLRVTELTPSPLASGAGAPPTVFKNATASEIRDSWRMALAGVSAFVRRRCTALTFQAANAARLSAQAQYAQCECVVKQVADLSERQRLAVARFVQRNWPSVSAEDASTHEETFAPQVSAQQEAFDRSEQAASRAADKAGQLPTFAQVSASLTTQDRILSPIRTLLREEETQASAVVSSVVDTCLPILSKTAQSAR